MAEIASTYLEGEYFENKVCQNILALVKLAHLKPQCWGILSTQARLLLGKSQDNFENKWRPLIFNASLRKNEGGTCKESDRRQWDSWSVSLIGEP